MLARHNDVEFDRGGMHFKVHVPDEVDFKLEIEIEDDEREVANHRYQQEVVAMASRSAWGGWIVFAGIVLLIIGSIDALQGLVAIFEDEYVVATRKGLALIDVTTWGWITLVWGVVIFCAGLGLLGGAGWARWLAIIGVGINAVQQVAFMANFPQAYRSGTS